MKGDCISWASFEKETVFRLLWQELSKHNLDQERAIFLGGQILNFVQGRQSPLSSCQNRRQPGFRQPRALHRRDETQLVLHII